MSSILESCHDLPERRFAAGENVLTEGANDRILYVLTEGSVEILVKDVQVNTVSTPGSILGEVSVLLDRPNMATVRALEPCAFRVAEDPESFLAANPTLNLHIARTLARRLHGVTGYLVDHKRQDGEQEDHLGMVDEVLESLLHHQK